MSEHSPELQKKIDALIAEHNSEQESLPSEVNERPRFVFHPDTPPAVGEIVQVFNGLDPRHKGGKVVRQLGRAWEVEVQGHMLIVHDPEDSWWDEE